MVDDTLNKKNTTEDDKTSDELKRIEIDILKLFISICKQHNLTYFIIGGTALGAYRHGGFIPWDDDIDVAMPRSDYESFLKYAQSEFPPNYFLQTHLTDKEYNAIYAKIRNSNTTFLETAARNLNINHGVFIDIFPIDGLPNARKDIKRISRQRRIVKRALAIHYYPHTLKRVFGGILSRLLLFKFTNKAIISYFEKKSKKYKYEKCDLVICHGGAYGDKEILKKEYYGKGSEIRFESLTVIGPERIEDYLSTIYGDYMILPPIEKRVAHHYCDIIDLKKGLNNK